MSVYTLWMAQGYRYITVEIYSFFPCWNIKLKPSTRRNMSTQIQLRKKNTHTHTLNNIGPFTNSRQWRRRRRNSNKLKWIEYMKPRMHSIRINIDRHACNHYFALVPIDRVICVCVSMFFYDRSDLNINRYK